MLKPPLLIIHEFANCASFFPLNEHHSTQNNKGPWQIFKMNNLIVRAILFQIIVLIRCFIIESPMMTSYQTNAQVHWPFHFWELHGGKSIYEKIP